MRLFWEGPIILEAGTIGAQPLDGTSTATVVANGVYDPDGIARVGCHIRPPSDALGSTQNPVSTGLPSIELSATSVDGQFKGTYQQFTTAWTQQIGWLCT